MVTANPGDQVKIITKDEEFEGILMPRPDLLEENITVVKLDTGYNIGIENKKIKEIKNIKNYSSKKETKTKIKAKKGLPNVSILSTGGTISSKIDYRTGGVYADYTAEDFVEMMPELANIARQHGYKVLWCADWISSGNEVVIVDDSIYNNGLVIVDDCSKD